MQALGSALTTRGLSWELVDAAAGARAPIVVIDSYRRRADDRTHFQGDLVVAVEDLDRDPAVDIAVEPSPGPEPCRRRARYVLAGASYALLDPRLVQLRRQPVRPEVSRVLVTGGGADSSGWGTRVATALRAALPPSTTIALVRGPWSAGEAPRGVYSVCTTDGLGPALAEADLVVTAAGITMLEALVLGRPTVAAVLFENQERQARAAEAAGAIVLADLDGAVAAAVTVTRDTRQRLALAARATEYIDGLGSDRVAEAICEHH
jgi:spore coat polysaccharide biosynthesis predicted glycosyltransferase SpsG